MNKPLIRVKGWKFIPDFKKVSSKGIPSKGILPGDKIAGLIKGNNPWCSRGLLESS